MAERVRFELTNPCGSAVFKFARSPHGTQTGTRRPFSCARDRASAASDVLGDSLPLLLPRHLTLDQGIGSSSLPAPATSRTSKRHTGAPDTRLTAPDRGRRAGSPVGGASDAGPPRIGALGRGVTHARLSDRQREVLRARCETGSRKGAAHHLRMSVRGVAWHLTFTCGCRDDAEACFRHHEELVAAFGSVSV